MNHPNKQPVRYRLTRNVTPMPNTSQGSKASQRMEKLAAIESEMLEEEQEALKQLLAEKVSFITAFESVKTEFTDLDGMVWKKPQLSTSTSSSASTIRPDGNENTPPLRTYKSSNPLSESISLPALPVSAIQKANDDSTIRAPTKGQNRLRLVSLPSKVDPSTMDIDEKIRENLRAAYENAIKKRTRSPVNAIFASPKPKGDAKRKAAYLRGRNVTPFPHHVVMRVEGRDSSNSGSPSWFPSVEGDDGTIKPNASSRKALRKGVRMVFGLGSTRPFADPAQ